jgi:serine/threonine-protein kinase RsbW
MFGESKNTFENDRYRLELPAKGENLDLICQFIGGIAGKMGFCEQHIYQIELIVDEACANVVKHAYKKRVTPREIIQLTVEKHADKIEIAVADRGGGFDPAALKTPDMDVYLKNSLNGGLGLHLIKQFSDDVKFDINPGIRNEVKMVKFLKKCAN